MMKDLNKLAKVIHVTNVQNGWYEGQKNTGEMIALIHSEVSEMFTAYQQDCYTGDIHLMRGFTEDQKFFNEFELRIKDSVEDELSDTFIRLLDICHYKIVDIDKHMTERSRFSAFNQQDNIELLVISLTALLHQKISLMLEADRKNVYADKKINNLKKLSADETFFKIYRDFIENTFEGRAIEALEMIITYCRIKKIDLERHIEAKLRYNALRGYKHGGKRY